MVITIATLQNSKLLCGTFASEMSISERARPNGRLTKRPRRSDDNQSHHNGQNRVQVEPVLPLGPLNHSRGNDDDHGAQGVAQDVEKHALHVHVGRRLGLLLHRLALLGRCKLDAVPAHRDDDSSLRRLEQARLRLALVQFITYFLITVFLKEKRKDRRILSKACKVHTAYKPQRSWTLGLWIRRW